MNLPPTFPLSMAAEHTPVRVVSIEGHPICQKRIARNGPQPGAGNQRVPAQRQRPFGGPQRTRFGLGRRHGAPHSGMRRLV